MLTQSKILERIDLSDDFWKQCNVRNPKLKKQVGLYEIESIDNATLIIIAINPKEYFEKYRNREINKKQKGINKDTAGMHFEAYTQRRRFLNEFYSYKTAKPKKIIIQKLFQVKNTDMQMVTVKKTQFTGLSGQRFYFYDGNVSLPFGHPLLEEVRKEKKDLKKKYSSSHQRQNN